MNQTPMNRYQLTRLAKHVGKWALIAIIIVYAATLVSGQIRADDESLDAAWYDTANLPWDELAFRSTHDAFRDYLNGILHPYAV